MIKPKLYSRPPITNYEFQDGESIEKKFNESPKTMNQLQMEHQLSIPIEMTECYQHIISVQIGGK